MQSEAAVETPKFHQGRVFEEKIVQALIVDHAFAEQMLEILNVDYFEQTHLKELTKIIFTYYNKYRAFPSMKMLASVVVKDSVASELLREQIIQYLRRIQTDPLNGDISYIKDESLDFCKRKALQKALLETLAHIEENKFDQIVPNIQKALLVGSEKDIGHIFLADDAFEKRMSENNRKPIKLPWTLINEKTQGGVGAGELWIVCASSGQGKSHALVDIGHAAACAGHTVAHYSLELSETVIANRYDARHSGISFDDLRLNKEKVRKTLETIKGKLIIKSYPTKSVSTMAIKGHLHKLAMQGDKPDIIVVDYGDLLRSHKRYDQKRLEEEAAYEDLRNLAGELGIPVVTATQTNRSALDEEVITQKHISECFGKFMVCDGFITMNRKKTDPNNNLGNMFLAKNRFGPDGIKFPMLINTAISKIEVLPPADEESDDDNSASIADLRKKLISFSKNSDNQQ